MTTKEGFLIFRMSGMFVLSDTSPKSKSCGQREHPYALSGTQHEHPYAVSGPKWEKYLGPLQDELVSVRGLSWSQPAGRCMCVSEKTIKTKRQAGILLSLSRSSSALRSCW